jgi:hypothetical protein
MFKNSTYLMILAILMCGYTCSEKKPRTRAMDRSQLVVDTTGMHGVKAAKKLCDPGPLGVYPEEAPFIIPSWTSENLGSHAGEDLADKLNSLKNGRTRIYLGQCFRHASDKLEKGIKDEDIQSVNLAVEALEFYHEVLDRVLAKQEQMLKAGS